MVITYRWTWSPAVTIAPYLGGYANFYFGRDHAETSLIPELPLGWSMRLNSGMAVSFAGGSQFAFGTEVGELGGGGTTLWSVRGRAAVPF